MDSGNGESGVGDFAISGGSFLIVGGVRGAIARTEGFGVGFASAGASDLAGRSAGASDMGASNGLPTGRGTKPE